MQNNDSNVLLDLEGGLIKKVCATNKSSKIYIETQAHEQVCPCFQSKTSKIHDDREQVIKDIPFRYKAMVFILKKRRYRCDCGKKFYKKYDFLPRYQRLTKRLVAMIVHELRDVQSLTKIAKTANISITTAIRILNKINYPTPYMPAVLSIDAFRGNAETGKFQCILVDGKKRKVLDVLPVKTMTALSNYFRVRPKINPTPTFDKEPKKRVTTHDSFFVNLSNFQFLTYINHAWIFDFAFVQFINGNPFFPIA